MSIIQNVKGRQVFDSRGNPTVEAEIILQDGSVGTSIVPSGASTGRYEAHELRDKNKDYLNKSVFNAVDNINNKISKVLVGKDVFVDLGNAITQESNFRIKSLGIEKNPGQTIMKKAVFTPCKKREDCPPWQLSAETITHDEKKK